jgi:two-component system NtrC family sensor kinase
LTTSAALAKNEGGAWGVQRKDVLESGKPVPAGLEEFFELSRRILMVASRGVSKEEFLREVFTLLARLSGCDTIALRLPQGGRTTLWRALLDAEGRLSFSRSEAPSQNVAFYRALLAGELPLREPWFTRAGSFLSGDADRPLLLTGTADRSPSPIMLEPEGYRSVLLIPITVDSRTKGLLELRCRRPRFFALEQVALYEGLAQTVGAAIADRRAQAALRERVKELTCLYEIAQLSKNPQLSIEELLARIVRALPPAYQYPELAVATISLDGRRFSHPEYRESRFRQSSPILIGGRERGEVEVRYLREQFEFGEDPFLEEEQNLLDGVAKQIALIVEGRKAEQERGQLREQLRHADRLATIGELAAGVAHELNEPIGNILGFAELARKVYGLPQQADADLEKILQASLHAREVVKKLLIFARQVPTQKSPVNLNRIVNEGLYFLASRCAKEGIEVRAELSPELPNLVADPAQMNQVLVNLVVNAIQAMPGGGRLTVRTGLEQGRLLLEVQDTGIGMSEEVKEQIFTPFFTTKEVGQGTGLGLPVVHGIVSSHGGSIVVQSRKGEGSRFTIHLPPSPSAEQGPP